MRREASRHASKIRVLVADDHAVVREGLAAIFAGEADVTVVGSAVTGEQAVELSITARPDVILMDLRMPGIGGVEATRRISLRLPDCAVLVLTTFDGEEEIYQALRAGARGYLLKASGRDEILSAIRGVAAGGRWISSEIADKLADRVHGSELTSRELEILALIAGGNSNKRIGVRLGITEGTVKGHVNSILGKLEAADRTEAVTRAVRRGIIRLDQPPPG